jgi:hypothetical protein
MIKFSNEELIWFWIHSRSINEIGGKAAYSILNKINRELKHRGYSGNPLEKKNGR